MVTEKNTLRYDSNWRLPEVSCAGGLLAVNLRHYKISQTRSYRGEASVRVWERKSFIQGQGGGSPSSSTKPCGQPLRTQSRTAPLFGLS